MKKLVIAGLLSGLMVPGFGSIGEHQAAVYAQKKDDKQRKDPVGPPVVKDKGSRGDKKDPPKKDKKH